MAYYQRSTVALNRNMLMVSLLVATLICSGNCQCPAQGETLQSFIQDLDNSAEQISCNDLVGYIPTEIGNLERLTYLDLNALNDQTLDGSLPVELGRLQRLNTLKIRGGKIGGTIPTQLGNLPELLDLDLSNNQLEGTIPTQLGTLTQLTDLGLAYMKLNGTVPKEIGNLESLNKLEIRWHYLTGSLPVELGKLKRLSVLNINGRHEDHKKIGGKMPTQLGNLTRLTELRLYWQDMTGTIPTELVNLSKLRSFDLFRNKLTGTVPTQLGELTELDWFILQENQFHGKLPTQFGKLTKLEFLEIGQQNLTGAIPTELGNLANLRRLYIGENNLSGEIPKQLGKLNKLTFLRMHDNKLQIDESFLLSLFNTSELLNEVSISNNIFNFPWTCDNELLTWYPEYSGILIDRNKIICDDVNIYGELNLNPHVLRIDTDAPGTHVVFRSKEINTTKASILLKWNYSWSDVIPGNIDATIRSSLANCEDFTVQSAYPTPEKLLGFQIRWNNIKICFLSDELQELDYFRYNITTFTRPATEYEIRIQPFYLRLFQNNANLIFGIQSKMLRAKTGDALPESSPSSIMLTYRSDVSISFNWSHIPANSSNGRIIGYSVECEECSSKSYASNTNIISINGLEPKRKYSFSIRAATTAGEGPSSYKVEYETCKINKYAFSSNGECNETESGYFLSEPSDQLIACSTLKNEIDQESCIKNGIYANRLILRNGYWRPNVDNVIGINVCPKPEFCTTKLYNETGLLNSDHHCTAHHTGVYCSDCLDGFRMSSSGCVMCNDADRRDDITLAALFAVLIILMIILYQLRMVISAGIIINRDRKDTSAGIWQLASKLNKRMDRISDVYSSVLSTKSPGNGNDNLFTSLITLEVDKIISVLEVHCFAEVNFYKKLLFATLFPLALVLFHWLAYHVLNKFISNKSKTKLFEKTFSVSLLVSFFAYEPVSQTIIEAFFCETIHFKFEDQEYLRADHRLRCDSQEYPPFLIYAAFMVAIYPVGIVCLYVYLFINRRQFFRQKRQMKQIDELAQEKLKLVEFLTVPYKDDYFWFEVYELIRRLLLTSFLSIVVDVEEDLGPNGMYAASAYAFVCLILSLLVLETTRPYKYRGDWLYSLFSHIVLCVATQISLWSQFQINRNEPESNRMRAEYETMIYSILFWLLLTIMIFFIIGDMVRSTRKSQRKNRDIQYASEKQKEITFVNSNHRDNPNLEHYSSRRTPESIASNVKSSRNPVFDSS